MTFLLKATFLCRFVPGGIHKVWLYRKAGDLADWYDARLKACSKLEKAECEFLRSALKAEEQKQKIIQGVENQETKATKQVMKLGGTEPSGMMDQDLETNAQDQIRKVFGGVTRPTHYTGTIPFTGKKVDTIRWCKVRRLTYLEPLLVERAAYDWVSLRRRSYG